MDSRPSFLDRLRKLRAASRKLYIRNKELQKILVDMQKKIQFLEEDRSRIFWDGFVLGFLAIFPVGCSLWIAIRMVF